MTDRIKTTTGPDSGFDWALLFFWMVSTTMGWTLGRMLLPGLWMVAPGLGIGLLQWAVLQPRIHAAWRWALATSIGWAIGGLFTFGAVPSELEFMSGPIIGTTVGIAQWLILWTVLRWSGWWIPISILAWTTGLTLIPGILVSGVLPGLLTGIALEILLRNPKQREVQSQND